MKVLGLDKKEYTLNTSKYQNIQDNKSSPHIKVRKLLHELFPNDIVLEEVKIPKTRLFLDFFLPSKRLIIEVHGEQHYKYNRYFYKNKLEFIEAIKRDNLKIEWSNINNFSIIILPYNEENQWRDKIESRNSET